jgi:DNA-binding FadR family transcriptional regulator
MEEKQKRFRGKSLAVQLQVALRDAEALQRLETTDDATISRMKLVQSRISSLTLMMNHKRTDQVRKLNEQLKSAKGEIERLKLEVERLTAALAAKPATMSQVSAVEQALAKFEASKGGKL